MHEEIVSYLREHPEGVDSRVLAEMFLKFRNPDPVLAHTAISAILKMDKRCFSDNSRHWYAKVKSLKETSLREYPLAAVYCLCDPVRSSRKLFFISIWEIAGELKNIFNTWLVDPNQLATEKSEMVFEGEEYYNRNCSNDEQIALINEALANHVPVFFSQSDAAVVRNVFAINGLSLTDDFFTVPELFKALHKEIPRPFTFQALIEMFYQSAMTPAEVRKAGEAFATCTQELISELVEHGIETVSALDECLLHDNTQLFKGKSYTPQMIQSLPEAPGVYGFKNKDDVFIYIGKANNLRRRISGYFRETGESPDKIARLRSESYSIITYQCGSELEALIYEYRLIRKHSPVLNSKIEIAERSGTYKPVPDCIILLPHVSDNKIMSFWLRENQKIVMTPLQVQSPDETEFEKELDKFFFGSALPAESTDFPELELATRWIKSHRDNLQMVEVLNYADAAEVAQNVRYLILQIMRDKKSTTQKGDLL